jgi:hypothetical protein
MKHSTLEQQDLIKAVLAHLPMQHIETLKDEAKTRICSFPQGVDDQTVAKDLGVPVGAVRRIREHYHGLLRRPNGYVDPDEPPPKPDKDADLKTRMAALRPTTSAWRTR